MKNHKGMLKRVKIVNKLLKIGGSSLESAVQTASLWELPLEEKKKHWKPAKKKEGSLHRQGRCVEGTAFDPILQEKKPEEALLIIKITRRFNLICEWY